MMNLTFSDKIYKCLVGKVLKFNEQNDSKISVDLLIRLIKKKICFIIKIITSSSHCLVHNLDFGFEGSLVNVSSIPILLEEVNVLWAIFVIFSTNEETAFN